MERNNTVRAAFLVGIVLAVMTMARDLGGQALMDVDESSYAMIAWNMVESGDWVVPTLRGKPSFLKPPFYFWSVATSYLAFGKTEFAVRVVSLFYGLVALVFTGLIARRLYGERETLLAPLILAASPGFFIMVRSSTTDMTLTAMVAMAMYGFVRGYDGGGDEKPDRRAFLFLWAGAALGTLTKGPIGIGIPFSVIFLYLALTGRWRRFLHLSWWPGLLLWAAIVVPWYAACTARLGPVFLEKHLVFHNVKKFFEAGHYAETPNFFFLAKNFLWMFFPWVLPYLAAILVAAYGRFRKREPLDRPAVLLLIWFGFPLLVFSLSKFKMPTYIDPGMPACALFVAAALSRWIDGTGDRLTRLWTQLAIVLAVFGATALTLVGVGLFFPHPDKRLHFAALFGVLILTPIAVRVVRRRPLQSILAGVFAMLMAFNFLTGYLHPRIMKFDPYREIGTLLKTEYADSGTLIVFKAGDTASLRFYSGKKTLYLSKTDELRDLSVAPGLLVLTEQRRLDTLAPDVAARIRVIDTWPLFHVAKLGSEFLVHHTRDRTLGTVVLAETVGGFGKAE